MFALIQFIEQMKVKDLIQYPLEYSLVNELSALSSALNLDENPPRLPTRVCFKVPVTAEIQSTIKGGLVLTILDNGQPLTLRDVLTNTNRFETNVTSASAKQMNTWLNKNPEMLNSILRIEIDPPQNSAWKVIPIKSSAIKIPAFIVNYRLYASDPLVEAENEHPHFVFLDKDGSPKSLNEFSDIIASFFKQHKISNQKVRCNARMIWLLKEQSGSSKQAKPNEQLMDLVDKVKALDSKDIENTRLLEIWTALSQGTKEKLTTAEKNFVKRQLQKISTESKNSDIDKLISNLSKQNRIKIDSKNRIKIDSRVWKTLNGEMSDRERAQAQEMVNRLQAMRLGQ